MKEALETCLKKINEQLAVAKLTDEQVKHLGHVKMEIEDALKHF